MSGLKRHLGAFEHFIWSTDQWSPRHFAYVARISGPLTANELRRGLIAAQTRHPMLQSKIEISETGPCFVPTPLQIPLRIATRSSVNAWRSEVAHELVEPFSPDAAPLMRVVFLRGPKLSELIFTVHHSIGGWALDAVFCSRSSSGHRRATSRETSSSASRRQLSFTCGRPAWPGTSEVPRHSTGTTRASHHHCRVGCAHAPTAP
jgi:hypothetical protein